MENNSDSGCSDFEVECVEVEVEFVFQICKFNQFL